MATKKDTRLTIKTKIKAYIDIYTFDGPIDDIIATLESLKDHGNAGGYTNLCIDVEPYGYDGGFDLSLVGERPETESERQKRLKNEKKIKESQAKQKAKKLENEKKQYLKLKKKFEGKS